MDEVLALFCEERYGIYMNSLANIELLTTLSNIKVVNTAASGEAALKAASASAPVEAAAGEAAPDADTAVEAGADIAVEAEADGDANVIGDDGAALEGDAGTAIEGEAAGTDTAATESSTDEIIMDETAGMEAGMGEIYINEGVNIDPSMLGGMNFDTGMMVDPAATEAKGSLLSSWPFVIGISAAVLVVSIALGALLARIKIKKGIELYED